MESDRASPGRVPIGATRALAVAGFALRLGYFAVGPATLLILAVDMPLTGPVIGMALLIVLFLARELVPPGRVATRLLKRANSLSEYYRDEPPKPFLYYVFFPLLAPYWLFRPRARREVVLYKSFSLAALGLLLATRAYDYFTAWAPTLPFRLFFAESAASFVVELLAFFLIIFPLTSTVVTYEVSGARRRLWALGCVAAVSLVVGGVGIAHRKKHRVRSDVAMRMALRAQRSEPAAHAALEHALEDARTALPPGGLPRVKWSAPLDGEPLERAQATLEQFFRPDEAAAFFLFTTEDKAGHPALVLYAFSDGRRRPAVWRALVEGESLPRTRHFTSSTAELVPHALP